MRCSHAPLCSRVQSTFASFSAVLPMLVVVLAPYVVYSALICRKVYIIMRTRQYNEPERALKHGLTKLERLATEHLPVLTKTPLPIWNALPTMRPSSLALKAAHPHRADIGRAGCAGPLRRKQVLNDGTRKLEFQFDRTFT